MKKIVNGIEIELTQAEIDQRIIEQGLEETRRREALCRDVEAVRDSKIHSGITFGGVRYQTRPGDFINIAGAATWSLGAMVSGREAGDYYWGDPDNKFFWIAEDNSEVPMDAQTCFEFTKAVGGRKSMLIKKAKQIKARIRAGEDVDINDDANWE